MEFTDTILSSLLQLFDSIRQFVSRAINGHETNTAQFYREIFFNSSMDPRLKKIAIYTFMRLFAQKDEWVKIYELLREVRTDTAVAPKTFRSIQNYLFILLSMKPPTSDSVELKSMLFPLGAHKSKVPVLFLMMLV